MSLPEKISCIIVLFSSIAITALQGQVVLPKNWNNEKIKGSRYIPDAYHPGSPFINDKFFRGEIILSNGTRVDNLPLRYNGYRDELIYFNTEISCQILIDKNSIKGFILAGERHREFRQQYYNGDPPGYRFFEILDEGEISLLVHRKVTLEPGTVYRDRSGRADNMSYIQSYRYFLYQQEKGYEPVKISRRSLLSKFDKPYQKHVRQLLRKNNVSISDEAGFLKAWKLIRENGININF